MTTFQLLIICATTIGLASLAAAVIVFRVFALGAAVKADPHAPPPRVGHRVTVHMKKPDDQTIFGVLTGDYTDRVVLEDAEYVTATGAVPIPGRQDIDTCDIAWIDVHALVTIPDRAPADAPKPQPTKPRPRERSGS